MKINSKLKHKALKKVMKNGYVSIGRHNASKDTLYKVYEDDRFEYHEFKIIKDEIIKDLEQKETSKFPPKEITVLDVDTAEAFSEKTKPKKTTFSFLSKENY